MPEYIAVQCFSCEMFQAMQKNKARKFKCKICNEKQSVRRQWARSSAGKDIRQAVQHLNSTWIQRKAQKEAAPPQFESESDSDSYDGNDGLRRHSERGSGDFEREEADYEAEDAYAHSDSISVGPKDIHPTSPSTSSRWAAFLDNADSDCDDLQLDDEHSGSTHNSGHGMYVTSRPEAKSSRRTRKRKGSNASGAGPEPSPPRRILQAHAAARKPFENCAPSIQNNRFGVQRELSFRRSPNMSGRIACNGGPRKQLRQEASSASCLEQEHQHQHQHAALLLLGRTSPSEIGTAPPTNNVDCATTTDPSPPETTAGRGTSHAAKSKSSSQRPQNPSVPRIPVEKSSWAQFL
eukprot:INCI9078.1.p1 GENE.INCI9078.1~~INCI9078.1.p1  ORF type:complete len:350 (-),score=50.97 INCI9078.1:108-1157(-)